MKLPQGWITGRKKVTMRKFLTSTLAALIFGGAIAATALPSQAGSYRHRGHHKHNDATAAAIIAGIAGWPSERLSSAPTMTAAITGPGATMTRTIATGTSRATLTRAVTATTFASVANGCGTLMRIGS